MDEPWPLATLYTDLVAIDAGKHDRWAEIAAEDLLLAEVVRDDDGGSHCRLTEEGKYLINLLREDLVKWNLRR